MKWNYPPLPVPRGAAGAREGLREAWEQTKKAAKEVAF